jgi:hypothetical protein
MNLNGDENTAFWEVEGIDRKAESEGRIRFAKALGDLARKKIPLL